MMWKAGAVLFALLLVFSLAAVQPDLDERTFGRMKRDMFVRALKSKRDGQSCTTYCPGPGQQMTCGCAHLNEINSAFCFCLTRHR
uniref:Conotoxin n=1 Tax=Conus betulinus TaxID=89764 RepID=A0A142C1J4_CONBE|nr:conotoxin [Conus betulinus]